MLSTNGPVGSGVDAVTAVPSILGFHPTRALVVLCLAADLTILSGLHVTLSAPAQYLAQLRQLVPAVRDSAPYRVAIVIVDDEGCPTELPRPDLADLACQVFTQAGVARYAEAYWASSTQSGGVVRYYRDPELGGIVPVRLSDRLLRTVLAGKVVFNSREEMADILRPDPPEVIERRTRQLNRAVVHDFPRSLADYMALVRAAVQSPHDVDDDHRFVELAQALSEYAVRDVAIAMCLGDDAERAEQLWFTLARGLPAPERAEPAVAIAVAALLRGDGTLANIALDVAEEASPRHRFACWLRRAQWLGLPVTDLRDVIQKTAHDGRVEISQE